MVGVLETLRRKQGVSDGLSDGDIETEGATSVVMAVRLLFFLVNIAAIVPTITQGTMEMTVPDTYLRRWDISGSTMGTANAAPVLTSWRMIL